MAKQLSMQPEKLPSPAARCVFLTLQLTWLQQYLRRRDVFMYPEILLKFSCLCPDQTCSG